MKNLSKFIAEVEKNIIDDADLSIVTAEHYRTDELFYFHEIDECYLELEVRLYLKRELNNNVFLDMELVSAEYYEEEEEISISDKNWERIQSELINIFKNRF
tara:strand:- start:10378 stop:10683 length:306 start_codon:yes stop_codon:yes gene_type:complete